MTKNLLSCLLIPFGLTMLLALPLTSCSDDDDGPAVELTLSENSATVKVGSVSSDVEITQGNGKYIPQSSNDGVCTATVAGSTISLRGIAAGTATITITDSRGKSATLSVTVSEEGDAVRIKLDKYTATVKKWEREEILIASGNGGYTFTYADPGIAEAAVVDDVIIVYGHAAGKTTATITDREGQQESFEVTVLEQHFDLEIASNTITLENGAIDRIEIISGNKNYSVVSSDNTVLEARIARDDEDGPLSDATYYIELVPTGLGRATVELRDNNDEDAEVAALVIMRYDLYIDNDKIPDGVYVTFDTQGDLTKTVQARGWDAGGAELNFELMEDMEHGHPYYLTLMYAGNERASNLTITLITPHETVTFKPTHPDNHRAGYEGLDYMVWPYGSWQSYYGAPPAGDVMDFYGTRSFEINTGLEDSRWTVRKWGQAGDCIRMNFGFGGSGYVFNFYHDIRLTSEDITDEWFGDFMVG